MKLSMITKQAVKTVKQYSPGILTGLGVAGFFATVVMAVDATPKAIELIEEKKQELGVEKLTAKETVQTAWKCYIPSAITAVASTACIIGASAVNAKRNAALLTAYTLSETAAREYRDKVVETIGEKKEVSIRDALAKDQIEKNPVKKEEIIVTGKGTTRVFDPWNARRFDSDIETIRKAINDLNYQLLHDEYVSLNDLYYALNLEETKTGEDFGWNVNRDRQVELQLSAQVDHDGVPCLVLGFINPPRYDYNKY